MGHRRAGDVELARAANPDGVDHADRARVLKNVRGLQVAVQGRERASVRE